MRSFPILVLAFMTLALPALAGDGVLEINQTCALITGCFAGDSAGLPVTIDGSAGRSYRLTSDLVVLTENTDGIQVSTDNVSIDLAGFEIRGPVLCSGTPLECTPGTGSGSGVERTISTLSGISVRDGSIRGMGQYGVLVGNQSEVRNVHVRSNRVDGISAGTNSTISGNRAHQNGSRGMIASFGSTFSGNTAYQNAGVGIYANAGSTVLGNTAYANGTDGIFGGTGGTTISGNMAYQNGNNGIRVSTGSTITGNTVSENGNDGIFGDAGCTVVENAAYDNGDATNSATDDGIQCNNGCIVRANSVRNNTGYGLNLSTDSAYSDNVVSGNFTGTVTGLGGGNTRGGNYCAGPGVVTSTCP